MFGSGGVIVPPAGYHRRMWELCQRYDVLYISDEVVTSFGRLGHFFASQAVFGVQPDIILTAKGLTSGYQPLGACIFSRRIWEVIAEPDKGRCFSHGFTYSGHPVACAAALKNIEIIEREGLLAHADEVGRYFEERLQSLRDLPIVGDVRGMRFMACVEFVADKASKALFPESLNIGEWVHLRAQKRGLLVRPIVHLNVMSPPLILTRETGRYRGPGAAREHRGNRGGSCPRRSPVSAGAPPAPHPNIQENPNGRQQEQGPAVARCGALHGLGDALHGPDRPGFLPRSVEPVLVALRAGPAVPADGHDDLRAGHRLPRQRRRLPLGAQRLRLPLGARVSWMYWVNNALWMPSVYTLFGSMLGAFYFPN